MRRHYDLAQCRCDVPDVSSVTPYLCVLGHCAAQATATALTRETKKQATRTYPPNSRKVATDQKVLLKLRVSLKMTRATTTAQPARIIMLSMMGRVSIMVRSRRRSVYQHPIGVRSQVSRFWTLSTRPCVSQLLFYALEAPDRRVQLGQSQYGKALFSVDEGFMIEIHDCLSRAVL